MHRTLSIFPLLLRLILICFLAQRIAAMQTLICQINASPRDSRLIF